MKTSLRDQFLRRLASGLADARAHSGLKVRQVTDRTGISRSSLHRIERGEQPPSLRQLFDLARAYRVSVVDLIGGAL